MYVTTGSPRAQGVGILPVLGLVASVGGQYFAQKKAGDAASEARKGETKMAEIAALRDRTAQVQARKQQTALLYAGAGVVAVGLLAWALTRKSS